MRDESPGPVPPLQGMQRWECKGVGNRFQARTVPDTFPQSITVATFFDMNDSDPATDFTATIDWGDGETSPGTIVDDLGGQFEVTGEHVYAAADGASYPASVTIQNEMGVASTVLATLAFLPAPAAPALTLSSISFSGNGQISLLKDGDAETSYDGTMPLNSSGQTPITNPVWKTTLGQRLNDPVAYVQGSKPHITVVALENGLEAGTPVYLRGVAIGGAGISTVPNAVAVNATGMRGKPLTFEVDLASALPPKIQNTSFLFDWQISTDNQKTWTSLNQPSRTKAFITWGQPSGGGVNQGANQGNGGVSARRLDKLTQMENAKSTNNPNALDAVVASVGAQTTGSSKFDPNLNIFSGGFSPFAILGKEVPGADCVSLANLMEQSLDLLGVGAGLPADPVQIMFVYARTATWNLLDQQGNQVVDRNGSPVAISSANSDSFQFQNPNPQGGPYWLPGGNDPNSPNFNLNKLEFVSGSWNRWEACAVFTDPATGKQEWWMGGAEVNFMPMKSDYDVLMHWTFPNQKAGGNHQAWYGAKGTPKTSPKVDWPMVPVMADLAGLTVNQSVAQIKAAGYSQVVVINDTPAPMPAMVGWPAGVQPALGWTYPVPNRRSPTGLAINHAANPHDTIELHVFVP